MKIKKDAGKIEFRKRKAVLAVLKQEITPESVLEIAEVIAICETKYLISRYGAWMIPIHSALYHDIVAKKDLNHIFSNGYDYVQTAAEVLCHFFGRCPLDIVKHDKRGKAVTIQMLCERAIDKETNLKVRDSQRLIELDSPSVADMPVCDNYFNDSEQSFAKVDAVIERMGLNEIQSEAVYCRMSGHSYPEIGRQIGRVTSSVHEMFFRFRPKFNAIRGEFDI